jgi:hypothetical protein
MSDEILKVPTLNVPQVPVVPLEGRQNTITSRPSEDGRSIVLSAPLPEGYMYPAPKVEDVLPNRFMGAVWKCPYEPRELVAAARPIGETGVLEIQTRPTENGEWLLPSYLSPVLLDVIKPALMHETLINPLIEKSRMVIHVKVNDKLNPHPVGGTEQPHADGPTADTSIYSLTTAPTTLQHSGRGNALLSSTMPLVLYHRTGREIHSMPQGESWDEAMKTEESRILVHIAFEIDEEFEKINGVKLAHGEWKPSTR